MNQLTDRPIARRRPSAGTAAARVLAAAVAQSTNFVPSLAMLGDTDNMPAKVASVLGPYRNGSKWRVVYITGGTRQSKVFDTYEEGAAVVETLAASLSTAAKMPIGTAVEEFAAHKQKQGLKPISVKAWRDRLNRVLPVEECLAEIDPTRAQQLYDEMTQSFAAATHRPRLRYVRAFFAWAVERGYVRSNPFAAVKPTGKARRGKLQLRIDEARTLYADLLIHARAGDDRYLGLMLQLLHGLRTGEVLNLRARDVDDAGTRLCVAMGRDEYGNQDGKTGNAARVLEIEVPELRALLLEKRKGRMPSDRLLGHGRPRAADYLWDCLTRACKRLGLPRVCPHSLRGLHATLAVKRGATSALVAGVLGHGSDEITKRHYIETGTVEAANARTVAGMLTDSPAPANHAPSTSALLEQLRRLSPADRATLLAAVGDKS